MEAGVSLGLQRGSVLRLIVIPQAMRVILPPLTNQYLNLTKNSSLAVAIGYPDLVSVFAGTTLSQTGQAIEIIAITMGVYLADLAGDQRDHEFLRMAARPEPRADERHRRSSAFVRAGTRSRARRAGQDHRLCRLPAHPAVQFADQHPAHDRERAAALVHRGAGDQIPAGRCGLARHRSQRVPGRECRTSGRRLLALHRGEIQPVHLRLLSGSRALAGQSDLPPRRAAAAAAVDSAAAGQGPQRRAVLRRVSGRRVFPAAWRRPQGLRRQLDGRFPVGIGRQHRRGRPGADKRRRDRPRSSGRCCWLLGKLIVAARHRHLLSDLAADLAGARSDPGCRAIRSGSTSRLTAAIVSILLFLLERRHCAPAGAR